jgi:PAS domain S-box-containing protein
MNRPMRPAWRRSVARGGLLALAGAALAIAIAIACMAVFLMAKEKQHLEEGARQDAQNLAQLLEATVLEVLRNSDLVLRVVASRYRDARARGNFDPGQFNRMLVEMQAAQPAIANLRVLDRDGLARFGQDLPISSGDRADFQRLKRDPAAGTVFSGPAAAGRVTGDPGIVLWRRLEAPDGSFAGAVSIGLTSASLHRLVSGLGLDRLDHVKLLDANARLIYRYPAPPNLAGLIGGEDASPALRELILAGRLEANFRTAQPGGAPRFESLRKVGEYPLNVLTSFAASGDLAASQRRSMLQALFVLQMVLLVTYSAWRVFRFFSRTIESEARWKFALEGGHQGVWDWDLAARKVWRSPRFTEMLGYTPEDFGDAEESWTSRTHPDDASGMQAAIQRHLSEGAPFYEADFRMRHRDGHWVWVHARGKLLTRTADGRPWRMVGTVMDVSEHHALEEENRRLTAALEATVAQRTAELEGALLRLQLATAAADIGIWTWEFDGDRIVWDERLYDMVQAPPDVRASGLLDELWSRHVPPEDQLRLQQAIDRCKADGSPLDYEYRLLQADGRMRYIHSSGLVQRDAQGRPCRLIGSNRDLTPQRELEASLKQSRDWLELALTSAGLATWDFRLDTGQLRVSPRWAEIMGYQDGAALPQRISEWEALFLPDDLAAAKHARQLHFSGETARYEIEYRVRRRDGV